MPKSSPLAPRQKVLPLPIFVEALKALNERVKKLEENKFDAESMKASVEELERRLNK